MGKKIVVHTDHRPLQHLQAQSKLQQTIHYKWMGFLQQFYIIINYKNGNTNKLAYMFSRLPTTKITSLGTLMCWNILYSLEGNNVFVLCQKLSTILCKRVIHLTHSYMVVYLFVQSMCPWYCIKRCYFWGIILSHMQYVRVIPPHLLVYNRVK